MNTQSLCFLPERTSIQQSTTWPSVCQTFERDQQNGGKQFCSASTASSPPEGGMSEHTYFGFSQGSCPEAMQQSLYQPLPKTEDHSTERNYVPCEYEVLFPDLIAEL